MESAKDRWGGDIFKGNSPPPTLPMHCATRNVPRVLVPLSLVARKALFVCAILEGWLPKPAFSVEAID